MTELQRDYPYQDGGFTIIGPECFANEEGTVISWRGANYYQACDHRVKEFEDGVASHCVRRVGHPNSVRHEDFNGNVIDEIYGVDPEKLEIPIPRLGMLVDGTPILLTREDVQAAWDAFVAPTQAAKEEMSPETRAVASILRVLNAALPATIEPKEGS